MQDGSGCAYDKESLAIIKLNNTTVLYLKEVTKFLALVCILREESFERKGVYLMFSSELSCWNVTGICLNAAVKCCIEVLFILYCLLTDNTNKKH